MNVTGIILAGGKSSRMGTDKGLVSVNGIPMVSHVIASMKKAGIKDIIIISNNDEYKQFGLPVFHDIIQNKGPLGGIYTGLSKSKTKKNLILSCDIPFVDEAILQLLIEKSKDELITVIKFQDRVHHLIGVFDISLISALAENLATDKLKVEKFNQKYHVKILEIENQLPQIKEKSLANINSMDELNKLNYGM